MKRFSRRSVVFMLSLQVILRNGEVTLRTIIYMKHTQIQRFATQQAEVRGAQGFALAIIARNADMLRINMSGKPTASN